MSRHVVTLNAGSSSIKFALFELDDGDPLALAVGLVEMAGNQRRMKVQDRDGLTVHEDTWSDGSPFHSEALQRVLAWQLSSRTILQEF
jgi:acetate kinase